MPHSISVSLPPQNARCRKALGMRGGIPAAGFPRPGEMPSEKLQRGEQQPGDRQLAQQHPVDRLSKLGLQPSDVGFRRQISPIGFGGGNDLFDHGFGMVPLDSGRFEIAGGFASGSSAKLQRGEQQPGDRQLAQHHPVDRRGKFGFQRGKLNGMVRPTF